MKIGKGENGFGDGYFVEVEAFLSMCSEADRNFLNIPKRKRKAEEYTRLMCIAITFNFRGILLKLVGEAEKKIKEVCACIKMVKKDMVTIKKWVDEFIETIPDPELKQAAFEFWKKSVNDMGEKDFDIASLMK